MTKNRVSQMLARLRIVTRRTALTTAAIHRLCIKVAYTVHGVAIIGYLTLIGDQAPLATGNSRESART